MEEIIIIFLILVWTLSWKGIALWKAARNSHKKWFIALFLLNTLGILEIVYIFFFSKPKISLREELKEDNLSAEVKPPHLKS